MQRQRADSRLLAFHRRHGLGGHQRHATPSAAKPAAPTPHASLTALSPVHPPLDAATGSVWESELWAWPLAAVAILVLWLALVVGGNAPVSAYDTAGDRPSADAVVETPTAEVAR